MACAEYKQVAALLHGVSHRRSGAVNYRLRRHQLTQLLLDLFKIRVHCMTHHRLP